MKRSWLIPVLIAIVIGAMAYGLTRWAVCTRCQPSPDRLEDVSFLRRELGLTETQAREIRQLQTSLGAKLTDCCERHCAARARMVQALTADTNGNAQAEAVLAEMCRAYEQSERVTLNHIRAVRAVLNAEQRRQFDTMISDCMCRPCSMHGGSCRTEAEGMATMDATQH